jgi:hypothetical protein
LGTVELPSHCHQARATGQHLGADYTLVWWCLREHWEVSTITVERDINADWPRAAIA